MSDDRNKMKRVLQAIVIPVLREKGFKGSFPHFRRQTDEKINLLTFQFDRLGGGFVVEIANCSPEGVTTDWGKVIPPNKVTAHDLCPQERLRLGAKSVEGDYWFRYDGGLISRKSTFEDLAEKVLELLESQAEKWWDSGKIN